MVSSPLFVSCCFSSRVCVHGVWPRPREPWEGEVVPSRCAFAIHRVNWPDGSRWSPAWGFCRGSCWERTSSCFLLLVRGRFCLSTYLHGKRCVRGGLSAGKDGFRPLTPRPAGSRPQVVRRLCRTLGILVFEALVCLSLPSPPLSCFSSRSMAV